MMVYGSKATILTKVKQRSSLLPILIKTHIHKYHRARIVYYFYYINTVIGYIAIFSYVASYFII